MKLIVTCRELHYAGRCRAEGEVFEASANDARVLKLAKRAADAPSPAEPVGQIASTRPAGALQSEALAPSASETATPPSRARRYATRGLKAED